MNDMLTAKEVQALLQVDRSTIYRMAESGRLPAIKVGKQWRFPAEQIERRFQLHIEPSPGSSPPRRMPELNDESNELSSLLPIECVELIQTSFADLLGVMLVVTDMEGKPITKPSRPCGLFRAINEVPDALQRCIESWQELASAIDLEPKFSRSHLGLLCARAMIRVGPELKGMVVAGCVAPEQWPPAAEEVERMAEELGVSPELIRAHVMEAHFLTEAERANVLAYVQRIANIVAHIVNERKTLVSKLAAIADLTTL